MPSDLNNLELRVQAIERDLSNRNLEVTLSGVTNPTADAQQIMAHSLGKMPTRVYPVYGDFYIKELTERKIDIRSRQSSQKFKLIIS